jgi:hypothetical protein
LDSGRCILVEHDRCVRATNVALIESDMFSGTYYVHTVDRSNLQAEEERLNAARSRPSRRRLAQ